MTGIYLEPIGLLYGGVAREAVSLWRSLAACGKRHRLCGVRLWEGEPGNVKYAIARTSTIEAIDEPRVKVLLERLSAPAPPLRASRWTGRASWAL